MSTPFQEKVYVLTKQIPQGKVATYKQIATLAGNPRAARVVGLYMKKNKDPKNIPCHRVVSSKGELTGYAFGKGIETKKSLLMHEGVSFIDDRVDLALSLWDNISLHN